MPAQFVQRVASGPHAGEQPMRSEIASQHIRPARRRLVARGFVRARAFTLVELLVAIGIIAILISILLPVTRRVRDAASTAQCLSNLRQVGLAISQYANDHRGSLVPGDYLGLGDGSSKPGAGNWADILVDGNYIASPAGTYSPTTFIADFPDDLFAKPTILRCGAGVDENAADNYPTSQTDPRGGFYFVRGSDTTQRAVYTWYAINCMPRLQGDALSDANRRARPFNFLPDYSAGRADWSVTKVAKLKARVPLIFDGVWCFNGDASRINARHNGHRSTNILFADGHCSTELTSTLPNEDWYLR
jgi:prepilin-type N-terminal cleavage/methylation domain-containing protein/prepilin-type processing-associated H-X9-DG protein